MGYLSNYHVNRDECINIAVHNLEVTPIEAATMVDELFEHMVTTYIGEWNFAKENIAASGLGINLYLDIDPKVEQEFKTTQKYLQ